MFAARYFAKRYFPGRYFPPVVSVGPVVPADGRLEYTVDRQQIGYAVRPNVIGYTPARSTIGYEVRR